MCWIGNLSDRRIANRDKVVYKVFIKSREGELKSAFREMPYKRNTLYETKFEIAAGFMEDRKVTFIGAGFHSFETFTGACKLISTRSYHKCGIPLVTKCIIPKGSIYYINSEMVVVSNKIIVTNEDCKW